MSTNVKAILAGALSWFILLIAGSIGASQYDKPVRCQGVKIVLTDGGDNSQELARRWFPHRNPSVVAPQIEALNYPGWQLRDSVRIPEIC